MDNNNFIVAMVLSVGILVGFHYFYEVPQQQQQQQQRLIEKITKEATVENKTESTLVLRDRAAVVAETQRLPVRTPELEGSINLKGARIDDLLLRNYKTSIEADAADITLLSPAGTAAPYQSYYAESGWLGENVALPDANTVWRTDSKELTPEKPVRLTWDNGQGLTFERILAVDSHFVFTITDRVKNASATTITLYPFGLIARHGVPQTENSSVSHEGPIGVLGGTVVEHKYKDLIEEKKAVVESAGGWLGITDKYWLVAMLPDQNEKLTGVFSYGADDPAQPEKGSFQVDFRGTSVSLAPGADVERVQRLFAGAKRVGVLDDYAERYDLPHFDRAIDFGWFYFLTKPFLYLLAILGGWFGNYGLAIFAFTIMLKVVTTPLSVKSYRSMARMKELQPEMQRIQEKFKEDKTRQQIEMMDLYKREKVNPMSGCWPNLIQIPIFFALYKVLYVGIELRHAPFYGWVHDMSAADPTSVLTLFGLIPSFGIIPHLGVWPLLMGLSMFLQQKLSPQPPDKSQARMFLFLPILFTFMLAQMSAGLVIYWTWSNILGIAQQWVVMKHAKRAKA